MERGSNECLALHSERRISARTSGAGSPLPKWSTCAPGNGRAPPMTFSGVARSAACTCHRSSVRPSIGHSRQQANIGSLLDLCGPAAARCQLPLRGRYLAASAQSGIGTRQDQRAARRHARRQDDTIAHHGRPRSTCERQTPHRGIENVTGIPVRRRNVAMVYQQFINYPSMTVFDNIASPLRLAGTSRKRHSFGRCLARGGSAIDTVSR